jgi:hypothetical protein
MKHICVQDMNQKVFKIKYFIWWCHLLITNSMEPGLSWESDSCLASQDIPCLLWNQKELASIFYAVIANIE